MTPEVPSVLQKIVAHKWEEVSAAKAARPRIDLDGSLPTRDFAAAIRRNGATYTSPQVQSSAEQLIDPSGSPLQRGSPRVAGGFSLRHAGRELTADQIHVQSTELTWESEPRSVPLSPVRLIAEVKHASPVKGVLREDFDPVALARTYAANGAAAISVLTDERFFLGHPDFLGQIREVVSLPLLRKEFIIDEWQLSESRALGADAVLLIVAILSPNQLRDYVQAARALDLAALVEVHIEPELEVALAGGARIIGVNNRDLNSFVTDLATTKRFASQVKGDAAGTAGDERILVSESGISSAADVARVAAWGADAVLVGEALVREQNVAAKARELSGWI